jgi:ABC-type uncharacterized transport system involved in gliding motility auxiliary subunit
MQRWIKPIWIFIIISLWIVNLVMYTVASEYIFFNQALLGSAIGLTLLFLFINRKSMISFFKKPYNKHFSTNLITIFLVTMIIILINHLSLELRYRKDFTKDQLHTLSQQSRHLVAQLKSTMKMDLFAKRTDWDRFYALLRQYESESKLVQVNLVDIETNPTLISEKGIKENGTLVINYDGREIAGVIKNELDITNMILKSQRKDRLKVYYTTGHKELDRNIDGSDGAKFLYDKIFQSNYILKPIDLFATGEVPLEADLLMILAPKSGFLTKEIKVLESFLERGGGNCLLLITTALF